MGSVERNKEVRSQKMPDFKLWLEKLPAEWLRNQIIDAYYHGYLEGNTPDDVHDLQRFFILETEHDTPMVPRPVKKAKKKCAKKSK